MWQGGWDAWNGGAGGGREMRVEGGMWGRSGGGGGGRGAGCGRAMEVGEDHWDAAGMGHWWAGCSLGGVTTTVPWILIILILYRYSKAVFYLLD